jgi:hypothetical protein
VSTFWCLAAIGAHDSSSWLYFGVGMIFGSMVLLGDLFTWIRLRRDPTGSPREEPERWIPLAIPFMFFGISFLPMREFPPFGPAWGTAVAAGASICLSLSYTIESQSA